MSENELRAQADDSDEAAEQLARQHGVKVRMTASHAVANAVHEPLGSDPAAAKRRAIVRAVTERDEPEE